MSKFIFLSGLPRSGSTLLSAILSENSMFHVEGNSPLCQIISDMDDSISYRCNEQIDANNKRETMINIIKQIPDMYYDNKQVNSKIIIDKCRSWTLTQNIKLIEKYICKEPKIIILYRNITEIINSLKLVYFENKKPIDIERWFDEETDPLMLPLKGLIQLKDNNKFLFINYDDLIMDTKKIIEKIYKYIEEPYFEHDFSNIKMKNPENDDIYGLKDFHKVYSFIKKEKKEINLPNKIIKKCELLNKNLFS